MREREKKETKYFAPKAALDKVQRKKLSLDQAPWTDIVHALIDYKLGQRSTLDPFSSHGSDMVVLFFEQKLKSFHPSKSWQRSRVALKNLPQEETGKSTEHSKSQLQEGIDFARSLLKFRFSEKATKIAPIFCGLHKNILTLLTFLPYYLLHCFGTSRRYRFCKIFIKVQVF